ncbi:MAG: YicC family protein [Myxococcales bacterium]|nr:YicC family protein [Myxococcales bacterium]
MRSMTGIGAGEAPLPGAPNGARVACEIRATNHRYLDVRVRVGPALADLVPHVEQMARERLGRGRFDVAVTGHSLGSATLDIDRARARAVFEALAALRDDLAPGAELPLSVLGSVPDIFTPQPAAGGEALRQALAAAFAEACADLTRMREREGAALAEDLAARTVTIRGHLDAIEARAKVLPEAYAKKLRDRVNRLAQSADVALDPGRLEQEVVLFADRVDVSEEIVRARSHVDQLRGLVAGTDPAGKKIEFLLQELARETNTIGAKGQDAEIARLVVEIKCEVEKMREQAQNVE